MMASVSLLPPPPLKTILHKALPTTSSPLLLFTSPPSPLPIQSNLNSATPMPTGSFYITENVKYEFDWDDEPRLHQLIKHRETMRLASIPPAQRPMAGSKRVAQYQTNRGYNKCLGHLLQSITAHPALSTRSFEELRLEYYAQLLGKPPISINDVITSAAVIPPLFDSYRDETDDTLPSDITMVD